IVEAVINKWPCTIEQVDDSGWTPLHIAAHLGNDKIIKLILEKEKSIAYAKNKEGLSALHIAAMEGNLAVMKELITACPDIYEMLDNRGQTAIHAATERGQLLPFLLFRMKPEFKGLLTLVSEQNEEGNTPFYLAAIKGHALSFRCMECAECDNFNATNKEGFTTMDKLFLGRLPFGEAWKEVCPFCPTLCRMRRSTKPETVPGGYNQSGNVGEGLAVLRKNTAFCVFLIANTLAFGLSTTSIFVHFLASSAITGNVFLREVVQHSISYTNWSVGALLVAFISGTYAVVPHSWGITVAITHCCCFLISLFFPFFTKIYY
ncbi:ankyrin repeat-containing protein, partial [Quercus suber]